MIPQFQLVRYRFGVAIRCLRCPAHIVGRDGDTKLVAWKSKHACAVTPPVTPSP